MSAFARTYIAGPPLWVYPTFCFIGFFMCMIPMRWHLRAWNVGTVMYMFWVGIANLLQGINAIIWKDNVRNVSTFWAYFSSRINYAATWGAMTSALIINHRLYQISRVDSVTKTGAERRRQIIVDVGLGIGVPIIGVLLQYVNSCNSYDIYEEIGPIVVARVTYVWLCTIIIPPILINIVSAVFAGLCIWSFNQRRSQFKQILASSSGLTTRRYWRIMGLSITEFLFQTPLSIYRMVFTIRAVGFEPYISWDHIHNNYSDIDVARSRVWRSGPGSRNQEFVRWSFVIGAIIFFMFFGFAEEARKNYMSAFDSVLKLAGRTRTTLIGSRSGKSSGGTSSTGNGMASMGKTGTMPVFIRKETRSKRDSFDSLSDISDADVLDEKHIQLSSTVHSASTNTLNDRPASPISIPPLPDLPIEEKPRQNSHDMV